MPVSLTPLSFMMTSIAGWLNQHQQHAIDYLMEENRVLREQIGTRRLRFTDDQLRRLASRGKDLSRKALAEIAVPGGHGVRGPGRQRRARRSPGGGRPRTACR